MSKVPINRSQGRSVVVSTRGIVASEHPLASQAGALVLSQGGHAVDAAVAANAVMGVVCPMMCGVGGDLFAIVCEHDGKLHGVNASGWAPAQLTPEYLGSKGVRSMPESGVHSITVPGAVAGWSLLLERFGRVPIARALDPAIVLAAEGFPVAEITSQEWHNQAEFLRNDPEAARVFLPDGRPLAFGAIFRNADLALTYREIAAGGGAAFYAGDVATKLIRGLARRGSTMTSHDLADFRAQWAEPVSTTYRGWDVFELPPNGAGIAALMMLNILELYEPSALGLHVMIEAKKLAYADMLRHVADPAFSTVPVAALLNKEFARERAAQIDDHRAQPSAAPGLLKTVGSLASEGGDTTYLSVVDRDGNMVSLIQSNFASFGSGIVAEGTGFPLQNRGALFTLDRAHPNVLAPRKRPLHTIIPAFMCKGSDRIAFGIMGGWNQSQAHAQFVTNIVDRGMNIQAALEAPRFTKLSFEGNDVAIERRFSADVQRDLAARGHELEIEGDFCSLMGGGQAVRRAGGVNYGASDPRKDGAAIPEP
ncbi:MAG TPA: gamma-glutamyltransferase [Vicinamibacterales bacterium]|nr:gamma-glutamyltransferase [Vicinamibacterales bacterium]